jgi:hypothetical protein
MKYYLRITGLSSKALSKKCGVSHSQMYMARNRNVGPENAEKIASCVSRLLGLTLTEKLELKAEIIGEPRNLTKAYLGGAYETARIMDEHAQEVGKVVSPGVEIPHALGTRVLAKLEEMDAPDFVIEDIRARVAPKYVPPGRVTHRQSGLEARNKRAQALFNLRLFKPKTAEFLQRSGLSKKEIRDRAGVGREAVRSALYMRGGAKTAAKIANVLGEELGLSEQEREAIQEELIQAPQENF